MKILAIESSCDETSAAVVENGTKIISNVFASSVELHQKSGGVIPEIAAREQLKCIIPVIKEAFVPFDAMAVTVGPGLIGPVLIGVETAKTLAFAWNKPIVPINHLVAHLYANWLSGQVPEFPAICLVVSGGHTELVLMTDHGKMKYLGGTRDDAAGEAFDKTARMLGLAPYFGGPAIAAAAAKFQISNFKFQIKLPRPMIGSDDLDFSFSGLKTAVLREVQKPHFAKASRGELAYEIQEAITDVLVAKVIKATKIYNPKSILLAGGVSANQRLREKLKDKIEKEKLVIKLFVPEPKLCTDNAAYIASCAFFNYHPKPWQKINANPGLGIV